MGVNTAVPVRKLRNDNLVAVDWKRPLQVFRGLSWVFSRPSCLLFNTPCVHATLSILEFFCVIGT